MPSTKKNTKVVEQVEEVAKQPETIDEVTPPTSESEPAEGGTVHDKKRVTNAVSESFVKKVKETLSCNVKLNSKELKIVCEAFVKTLVAQVKAGDSVSFTNNMTFKRVVRDNRTHKNPKTGEEVFKPAHYVMAMEVKPSLKKQFEEIPVDKKQVAGEVSDF